MSEKLARLGLETRALQDRVLFEREHAPVEQRLTGVRGVLERERRGRRWSSPVLLAAASFVVTASALFYFVARPVPALTVSLTGQRVQLGGWLASEHEAMPLEFSDGTSLTLASPSRARLVHVDAHGAELALERGTVHATVVKRASARWIVDAGPFQILVTGTRFDASWDPEREVLSVEMHEGSVKVTGRCVEPKSLSAGESGKFTCQRATAPPPTAPSASNAAAEPSSQALPPVSPRAAPSASAGPGAGPELEWNDLSREGRFKESLAAAEQAGFSNLCSTLGADRLLELGKTARLAGSAARAGEAFVALRRRFGGSAPAAVAAFQLGRLAFDGGHDYASARRWFQTYLSEQPAGRFAEDALGRLMEAQHRGGDRAGAAASASQYLSRFPSGAHVPLARSLTQP